MQASRLTSSPRIPAGPRRRITGFLALAAGLAAAVTLPASAAQIWVANWGNDGANGYRSDRPVKTLQEAAKRMNDGDEIRVHPGTYETSSNIDIRKSGAVRAAQDNNRPLIRFRDSGNFRPRVVILTSYFTWDGVNVDGGGHAFDMENQQNITIKNTRIRNSWEAAIRFRRSNNITVDRVEATNCGQVNGDRQGSNNWPHIILGENSNDVVIKNCRIYRNHGEGIGPFLNCRKWRINRNQVYDNWSANIYIDTNADDADVIVERNLIYNTGWWTTSNSKSKPRGILISNEFNHGVGGWETRDLTIRNNIILTSYGAIEAIRYNWKDNYFQLKNCKIVNNTIVGSRDDTRALWISHGTGNVIRNNIFYQTAGTQVPSGNTTGNNHTSWPGFKKQDANGWNSRKASDYALAANSPCRDAGSSSRNGVGNDYFGKQRSGRIDVGADEY